ncbi:(Fe-S)-binding protein [Desulforegula conservatrix]|uniref:(Fe-S)-binding protein n=1 Tax=Desulforegula conservatrix TaxID=153026 RepID=UPI00042548AD|nr:(Fe-S)-binding protein [Desulforegula conservatrix]
MGGNTQKHDSDITKTKSYSSDSYTEIAEKCTECMKCVAECDFLKKYGSPKKIADSSLSGDSEYLKYSFECSLCGLCDSVCPCGLKPADMFLAMRCESVNLGIAPFKAHSPILSYEKKGTSKLFTYYSIPENCDTVFFPGCTFTGSRPESTMAVLDILRKKDFSTGIVLDCCCKPSHDLGRMDYFNSMFSEMRTFLLESGIKKIIVACPNCHKVFSSYGSPLEVITIYEVLADSEFSSDKPLLKSSSITIHDPCVLRDCTKIHDSVRKMAAISGCTLSEMKHSRERTLCCGEGGAAGFLDKELADSWKVKRSKEAGNNHLITYCAGCSNKLGGLVKTSHIIDFVIDSEKALTGKTKVSKAPFTYLNRLLVKWKIKKNDKSPITRERNFSPGKGKKIIGL